MAATSKIEKKDHPALQGLKKSVIYSHRNLHAMKDASELIRSHQDVVEYWAPYNEERSEMERFRKGKMWSEKELKMMKQKGKAPVVFSKIISAIRTIMGTFINNRYDIKPAPFEPTDQDVSDIITQRYHYNAHQEKVRFKDPELMEIALVEGEAWQESYVDVRPGMKPKLVVKNQNNKAIYRDPNCSDLIDFSDCNFIDRDSFMSLGDMIEFWPEHATSLKAELSEYDIDSGGYEGKDDRSHESQTVRNGRFRVTERFYKVRKRVYYGVSPDYEEEINIGEDLEGGKREAFKRQYPEYETHSEVVEFLYLAVACSAWSSDEFLFNEEYHCQPRDPRTKKILFTLNQLICEKYNGDTNGFVLFMRDPNKVVNSMMANKLHAAKHAVNTSLIVDPNNFKGDDLEDFENHHSDGDRTFKVKPGVDPSKAASLLPQGKSAPDTDSSLEYANMFGEEVSSAPPAARGVAEGNVPASLNEQRIQQAFVQLTGFSENLKLFLMKRAILWLYYDQTYFTEEETFRVIEKKNPEDEDWVTMNEWVIDEYGNIEKANDIASAEYDIVFEDSWQSATVRDKVRQQIIQLQETPAAQADPVLSTFLTLYFLKLSDAPQDLKEFVREHSTIVKQTEQQNTAQAQQSSDLENLAQVQNIAQVEAEQTTMPPEEEFNPGTEQSQVPYPTQSY